MKRLFVAAFLLVSAISGAASAYDADFHHHPGFHGHRPPPHFPGPNHGPVRPGPGHR